MLKDLKYQLKWKGRISAMLKRIKLLAKDQSLSVRQRHLLWKLVVKARKNKTKVVVEDIAYMIPGKSIATLESLINNLTLK